MGISKMRVEFTVNYLVDRGVITEIIKLIPVGESQPMQDNTTEVDRTKIEGQCKYSPNNKLFINNDL